MNDVFKEGLPIENRWKLLIVLISFVLLVLNHNLLIISDNLDYQYRDYVSLLLLTIFVVFSIGSYVTEGIVIGIALFTIMSNVWDFSVVDVSMLRKQVLIGSFVVLLVALSFGKISIYHLIDIMRGQLGVK